MGNGSPAEVPPERVEPAVLDHARGHRTASRESSAFVQDWVREANLTDLFSVTVSESGALTTGPHRVVRSRSVSITLHASGSSSTDSAHSTKPLMLPMLSPTIFFNLTLGIIGSFQVFTSAYIMTGGGPNNASLFYQLYLFFNAFRYYKMGYA